jgi:hypothetical protein
MRNHLLLLLHLYHRVIGLALHGNRRNLRHWPPLRSPLVAIFEKGSTLGSKRGIFPLPSCFNLLCPASFVVLSGSPTGHNHRKGWLASVDSDDLKTCRYQRYFKGCWRFCTNRNGTCIGSICDGYGYCDASGPHIGGVRESACQQPDHHGLSPHTTPPLPAKHSPVRVGAENPDAYVTDLGLRIIVDDANAGRAPELGAT